MNLDARLQANSWATGSAHVIVWLDTLIGGRGGTARRLLASRWIRYPCDYQEPHCITSATRRVLPQNIQICPAHGKQVLKQALRGWYRRAALVRGQGTRMVR